MLEKNTGKITRKTTRGFGFIQDDSNEEDIFFHCSSCDTDFDLLKEGDRVTFEVKQGEKGREAVNIQKIEEE